MNILKNLIYVWVIISIINLVITQIYGMNNFEKMYEERNLDIFLDDESKELLDHMKNIAGSVSTYVMMACIIPLVHLVTSVVYIYATYNMIFRGRR